MKALKIIGIIVTILLAIIFVVPAFLPDSFYVQRSTVINATPQVVFGEVNSFQKWEKWSPWIETDTTISNMYGGPDSGVGNNVRWTSKNSGDGSMEIIESVPYSLIKTKLMLGGFTPFEGHLTFQQVNQGTKTTWADSGKVGYIGRWIVIAADKMMGPDFERGLANLKKHVEQLPVTAPQPIAVDSTILAK
jgi:hypothetical protein